MSKATSQGLSLLPWPMLCDSCGQEVGKCDPSCPYHGVVFIDDFLTRRKSGHPSVGGALTPGAEIPPITQVFDLETYRKKKEGKVSKMSDLHLQIQQLIDHQLEKQDHPIHWTGTASSLYQAVERLKEEMIINRTPMSHGQAVQAVLGVLSMRLQDHLENGVPPRGDNEGT